MAILLVVSAEERRRRLLGRGEQLTEEETKLDKSKLFQERLVVLHMYTGAVNIRGLSRIANDSPRMSPNPNPQP